jgi:peptidoglycan/xylan/chitin deacetylase (PgdA/CDA1 family)
LQRFFSFNTNLIFAMNPTLFIVLCGLISIRLSAQSITIHFDWESSTKPSISKAKLKYNKDFAYSFTFDDATSDGFTTALPLLQGGTINGTHYEPLQYTDGCGNALDFKAGIAWNTSNLYGIDGHTQKGSSLMTWQQLDDLYNLGWDVLNHSYSHKARSSNYMNNQDYAYEVEQNRVAVRQRTASHIEMPLFVAPSGDTNYYAPAIRAGHRVVFDQYWLLMGNRGLQIDADIPTTPLKLNRQMLDGNGMGMPVLDEVARKCNQNKHFWYNQFAHRIDDYKSGGYNFNLFKNHIQMVANKYGKNGSDKMWMAPLQEVYEYLITRQAVGYTTKFAGKEMTIRFDLDGVPSWTRRKVITLLVNARADFSQVDVPQGVKVSFKGVGSSKMINLDFTNWQNDNLTNSKSLAHKNSKPNIDAAETGENIENERVEWSIFNEMGQLMLQENRTAWDDFDLSALPKGIYIALTRQGTNVERRKFIKL